MKQMLSTVLIEKIVEFTSPLSAYRFRKLNELADKYNSVN